MKIPTTMQVMEAFDHWTLAERVIALEVAFAKLMDTQCSPEQANIIKDAFPRPPIGHAWSQWSNDQDQATASK